MPSSLNAWNRRLAQALLTFPLGVPTNEAWG